jgi:hypothetical protein
VIGTILCISLITFTVPSYPGPWGLLCSFPCKRSEYSTKERIEVREWAWVRSTVCEVLICIIPSPRCFMKTGIEFGDRESRGTGWIRDAGVKHDTSILL